MALVWIIGMPGSGKTTVGKVLADRLGTGFHDVDEVIEGRMGKDVGAIFDDEGEAVFRSIESAAIRDLADGDGVVACGGGAVLDPENRERMRSSGTVFLLEVPVDALAARAHADLGERPLLRGPGDLGRLEAERAPSYRAAAHFAIDADAAPAEIADRIVEALP